MGALLLMCRRRQVPHCNGVEIEAHVVVMGVLEGAVLTLPSA
jgi:hypothetical protein